MSRDRSFLWILAVMAAIVAAALAALAVLWPHYHAQLPFPDSPTSWKTYTHPTLGYTLEIPADFEPDPDGDSVLFRYQGSPLIHVGWLTEEVARSRGLWPRGEPAEEIVLGGIEGRRYRYSHFDALFGVKVVADVVPYRDRFLALEFRRRGTSILEEFGIATPEAAEPPAEYQQRVRTSVRFD